jgi:hypothetical protein
MQRPRLSTSADKHNTEVVQIYAHPEEDTKYTMGIDAATGFGADYTSIQVFSNRIPFEQVAWLRNKRLTTVKGSKVAYRLAKYYNDAFIVPETRHPGNAYVDNLIEVHGYGRIYQKQQDLDDDPSVSSKYGICTTEADKHLLINQCKSLMEALDGPQIILHDEITLNEFCNFVYIEDKRKTGAGTGFHDDTVMAVMLALRGCILYPQPSRTVIRQFTPEDEELAHHRYLMKKHMERLRRPKQLARV